MSGFDVRGVIEGGGTLLAGGVIAMAGMMEIIRISTPAFELTELLPAAATSEPAENRTK